MIKNKMVISFSGIDSAGKSTQIEMLYKYFCEKSPKVMVKWSKARATPGVVLLKSIFRRDKKMNYKERLAHREEVYSSTTKKRILLIASIVDLWFYWGVYFRWLRMRYSVLILDRYLWDTFVELKTDFAGINFEKWLIWKILVKVAMPVKKSFILTIPLEVSLARDIQKTDVTVAEPALIDSKERKIHKINLYFNLIQEGKWSNVVDGTQSIETVHDIIKKTIDTNGN